MSNNSQFRRDRVFRDPVHGLIHINSKDEFLTRLVDTPEFQRLHRVRQLGVANLTFPGADHSRFSHSLGVLHIASRILDVLRVRYHGGTIEGLVEKHSQTIKAAALLHDIGHGPFSHLIERAFESGKHHESRSKEIIISPDSTVRTVLHETGQDSQSIKQVIDGTFQFRFLQDIVSSQLDADRMDYLVRDSHFAGVNYGVFDLEWILNCICIGNYSKDVNNPQSWRLSLDKQRGLQAAEQLILARQHMSLQVYYHRSTRRWEAIFLCLIREAVRLAQNNDLPKLTPSVVTSYIRNKGMVNHFEFLSLDEPLMMASFAAWRESTSTKHKWLSTLAKAFLERKKVLERVDLPEDLPIAVEALLRATLQSQLGPKNASKWEFDAGEFKPYKGNDPSVKDLDPEGYEDSAAATSILLSTGEPSIPAVPVAEESSIFKLLIGQQFRLRRLYELPRIFGPKEV